MDVSRGGNLERSAPDRMMRISPKRSSVPWNSRQALRSDRGMLVESKALYAPRWLWASRQLWRSTRTPLPTTPCSDQAVKIRVSLISLGKLW